MGWVVYYQRTGNMVKYYKKEASAKTCVTKNHKAWDKLNDEYKSMGLTLRREKEILAHCSWDDYEGIMMGLRGDEFKMWQFCNKKG